MSNSELRATMAAEMKMAKRLAHDAGLGHPVLESLAFDIATGEDTNIEDFRPENTVDLTTRESGGRWEYDCDSLDGPDWCSMHAATLDDHARCPHGVRVRFVPGRVP